MKKIIEILIWLPWSGKSYYRNRLLKENKEILILSSDDIRDELLANKTKEERDALLENNVLVNPFPILNDRLIKAIKQWTEYIVIDATNLIKKNRKQLIETIKSADSNNEYTINWTIFYRNIFDLYDKIEKRNQHYLDNNDFLWIHRILSKEVINKMLRRIDIPGFDEWFNNISIINYAIGIKYSVLDEIDWYYKIDKNDISTIEVDNDFFSLEYNINRIKKMEWFFKEIKYLMDLFYNWTYDLNYTINSCLSKFKEIINLDEYFIRYLWFEQTSKWHKEDLYTHIELIFKWFLKIHKQNTEQLVEFILNYIKENNNQINLNLLKNNILNNQRTNPDSLEYFIEILYIILYHDVWKLWTRRKKIENLLDKWYNLINWKLYNRRGQLKEIDWLNDYQFLWHDKVSAVIYNFEIAPLGQLKSNDQLEEFIYQSVYFNIKNHIKYHDFVNWNNKKCSLITDSNLPYNPLIWLEFEYLDNYGKIQ